MTDHLIKTTTDAKRFPLAEDLSHSSHIRLYPSMPGIATLQIRSRGSIAAHGKTEYFVNSAAWVDLETAINLRAALDEVIEYLSQ